MRGRLCMEGSWACWGRLLRGLEVPHAREAMQGQWVGAAELAGSGIGGELLVEADQGLCRPSGVQGDAEPYVVGLLLLRDRDRIALQLRGRIPFAFGGLGARASMARDD